MRNQRQGVRSTQPATQPQDGEDYGQLALAKPKQQDFIIKIYNVQRTLYTNQTGNFSRTSSRGNKYQMFLHKIDSNSTWVEPMSIKTEQSMIAARACGLERMRGAGLDPKHQILNNEVSENYKAAITNSGMTYQLSLWMTTGKISPRMKSSFGNTILSLCSVVKRQHPPSTFGVR